MLIGFNCQTKAVFMFTFEGEVWNQTITLYIPSFDEGMKGKNARQNGRWLV
jgi:hypothetical protein